MKIRLNWRSEDLTFRKCRKRTAFELEMFFGTSSHRHKLKHFTITSTDLPGMYLDSSRESNEVTFGVGNADSLKANRWYSITYRFAGRLGPNEFMDIDASRGYRLSPCIGGYAICVSGWRNSDKYGPQQRIKIYRNLAVKEGRTSSWSYPPRGSLKGKILRHPKDGDAYVLDGAGVRHWIPTGGMYNCLVGNGMAVVNAFADISQRWVINSFSQGHNASCIPRAVPLPQPQPPPQARGYHIEDYFLGGTWARTDPNNGTWYSQGNRPANGAYWYPNGLGIAVDCARAAAGYTVKWADGHTETWNTWFHVTDGKWYPSAATREILSNGFHGLRGC